MDYDKKIAKLDEHLRGHPHDYQAVISRLKIQSDAYEHEIYKRRIGRLQRLAEIKKRMEEGEYGGK